jgi:hypothetical protein
VPKTRIPSSLKLATLGAFAFAAQFGCSDDPQQPMTMFPSTAGSGNGTAGTPSTGGSPFGTAGTASTAGTPSTGGSPFGTAGTPTTGGTGGAGTAGATTGGTGGAGTAGAGTAGTGIVPQDPFCKGKTLETLPFSVTTAFYPSGWYPDGMQIELPGANGAAPLAIDGCGAERAEGAVGACTAWRYKPKDPATWAAVGYVTSDGAGGMHAPVCLAEGATALTFLARGVKGGEKLSIGGLSIDPEQEITLTPKWKRYSIPLAGVTYNSFESGVKSGFSWKVDPVAAPEVQPVVEFFVDDIQVVSGDLPDPGGEGGAGGGAN